MYEINSKKRFSLIFYENCPPHSVDREFFIELNGYDDALRRKIDAMNVYDFMLVHTATTLCRDADAL